MTRWIHSSAIILVVGIAGCGGSASMENARLRAELEATQARMLKVVAEAEAAKAKTPAYLDELERLDALRSKGALTNEEFETKKQSLLSTSAPAKPTVPAVEKPLPLTVKEIAAQLRTLQSLAQSNTLTIQEHNSKKTQLIAKPLRLEDFKADLEQVQQLFSESVISIQEYNQLKQKVLEIDQTRVSGSN